LSLSIFASLTSRWQARASRRLPLLYCLAVLLSACGFTPVYGDRGLGAGVARDLAAVRIDSIPEREGQMLHNRLIDRFYGQAGQALTPRYRLSVALTAREEELGIQRDATATRARLRLQAEYELIDNVSGQVVYRTFSRSVISYNLLESQFAILASKQDAYERGMTELADDIRTRLSLYFSRRAGR
jgi:LPS-assembly lipoprotein